MPAGAVHLFRELLAPRRVPRGELPAFRSVQLGRRAEPAHGLVADFTILQ